MTVTLFRHNNLDGVGCEIILRRKIKEDIDSKACDYDTIDQLISSFLKKCIPGSKSEIYILDICPSKDTCLALQEAYVDKTIDVLLVDHHKTRAWVKQYLWAKFDQRHCATQLTLNELGLNPNSDSMDIREFVKAVESWDLWQLDSPYRKRGEDLNALLNFLGDEVFINAFVEDPNADENFEPFKYALEILKRNIERYVQWIVNSQLDKSAYIMDGKGHSFKIIFASEHVSRVGSAILAHKDAQDLHYVVVVDPITNSCHLRSREGENIDVSEIATKFGGGGHTHAAGFKTNIKNPIRERIAELLNKME